jgi:hypothetical protein
MSTGKPQEINFFKGLATNPNSLSAGAGTFREIKNGWCLRDGIIDKRPGFSLNPKYSRAPGFSTAYTGLRELNGNTYYRQDTNFGAFGFDATDPNVYMQPEQIINQAFFPYTGADTIDCYRAFSIATDGSQFLALGKSMSPTGVKTEPFIMVFSLATGELIALIADTGTTTQPKPYISWRPDGTAFYFSRNDTNKIYKYVLATGVVTVVAGSGTAGLGVGAGLTGLNIGPINGIKYHNDGTNDHIYACVSNAIYDANLTANTGAIIAGSATPGHVNATGGAAEFNTPVGLDLFDSSPTIIYVADQANSAIRKVTTAGVVTDLNASVGTIEAINCLTPKNGSSVTPLIYFTSLSGGVYTLDTIDPTIPGIVNIFAGTDVAYRDGPSDANISENASFRSAFGVCTVQDSIAPNGTYLSPDIKVFVCDFGAARIRCLDTGPDGMTMSTWAGIGQLDGAGSDHYCKNNLRGFAGGVLPPASNIPSWPAPNKGILSNGGRESGFGLFEYNGTTYLNTNRGVVSFDLPSTYASSQIIRYAGAPQGLDLILTLTAGTLLPADNAVAYRIVWGYKTASGRSVIGAPSSRSLIDNPAGAGSAQNVAIESFIPPGADGTWTYQLYRTLVTFQNSGSGVVVDPGDTEFLVFESSPSTTDLAAGFVTIADNTPDSLLGADLYTNATQETLSQANNQPPICQDMCLFGDLAIYANTIQKQTMFVNLVGTGGFSGSPTIDFTFSDGVAGFTLTGNSSTENAPAGQFEYFTGATPASNVANTAQSIIRTINQYTANRRINAFYVSSADGVPGQIAIVATFFGCPAFSIDSLAAISVDFSPPLPTSDATWSGPSYVSVAEISPNGLYVAKEQEPDSVPLVNNFFAGSSSQPIWRVLPLRTSVIIIKEGAIWRLTGTDASNVQISLLDNTVKLRSPASCSLLNNEVWALTTQGVVAISDNGVRIVSHDIEYQITQATGTLQAPMDLMNNAWGLGSDDWRAFFLSVMANEELQLTFVSNPLTGTWSLWDLFIYAITCTNGQFVAAVLDDPARASGIKGQKPFIVTQNDQELVHSAMSYADFAGSATIASINGNVVTLNYSAPQGGWAVGMPSLPDVGWALVDADGTSFYYVTANASGALTLSSIGTLNMGDTVYVWRPIDFHLRLNPMNAGQTFAAKQWGDMLTAIESLNVNQFMMGFLQNSSPEGTAFLEQVKALAQTGPTFSNGVPPPNLAPLFLEQVQRLTVPKGAAYGNALEWIMEHSEAFSYMVLKAIGPETLGTGSDKVQQ